MAEYKKVTPYDDVADSKKTQVTTMFDKVAPYYDFLNRFLSLRIDVLWRKKALRMLAKSNPKKTLDIATGTADLAIMANKIWKPEKIIGLDISKEMLRVGQTKVDKKSLSSVISWLLLALEILKIWKKDFLK